MEYTDAISDVERELMEAVINYGPMQSFHEGYAILLEEVDELWDEIKKKPIETDIMKIRNEAKQIAAMAIRIMSDLT